MIKMRIFELLESRDDGDTWRNVVDWALIVLIAINVIMLTLETIDPVYSAWPEFFRTVEAFSVAIFSIEYLLRLWVCTMHPEFSRLISGRVRFAFKPLLLIDLIAIVPFFLPMAGSDLRALRILRLLRLLRIVKLGRYSQALQLLARVLVSRRAELLTTALVMLLLLLLASSLMYVAESESQPDVFSSIPAAMWWGVATLTTVGYGDLYPVTVLGKVLASVVAVLGIGMFALPTGVLGTAFMEELNRSKPSLCPHCGKNTRELGDTSFSEDSQ